MIDYNISPNKPSYLIIGIGCLILCLGFFLLRPEIKAIGQSTLSLSWQQSEAKMDSVKYSYVSLSEGTAFRTNGQYTYTWEGREYTSNQLFFSNGGDNLGYHKKKYRELLKAKIRGQSVSVWVNPKHPGQAVLYRGVRLDLLGVKGILVGFCAIFGSIVISIGRSYRSNAYEIYREQFPQQPWMWKREWQSAQITSKSQIEFKAGFLFMLVLLLIALSSLSVIPREIKSGNLWIVLAFLPVIVALWYSFKMFGLWRSLRLEKHMSFFLDTRPALLGKTLSARLVMPNHFITQDMSARLLNKRIITKRTSEGTSFTKDIAHQEIGNVREGLGTDHLRTMHIKVDIPSARPATSWEKDHSDSYWELEIKMRIKSTWVTINYEVPVADPEQHLF